MQGSAAYSQPETPAQSIQSNPAEPSVPQTVEKQPTQSIRPVPILPSDRRPAVESVPQAETETLENTASESLRYRKGLLFKVYTQPSCFLLCFSFHFLSLNYINASSFSDLIESSHLNIFSFNKLDIIAVIIFFFK